jgi:hypothetical protein
MANRWSAASEYKREGSQELRSKREKKQSSWVRAQPKDLDHDRAEMNANQPHLVSDEMLRTTAQKSVLPLEEPR